MPLQRLCHGKSNTALESDFMEREDPGHSDPDGDIACMTKTKRVDEDLELDTHQSKVGGSGRRLKSQRHRVKTKAKLKGTHQSKVGGSGRRLKSQTHRGKTKAKRKGTHQLKLKESDLMEYMEMQYSDPDEDILIGGFEVVISNTSGVVVDLCKLALKSLEDSHPGEKYELVGVKKATAVAVSGYLYKITFEAKNLKGDVKTFQANGHCLISNRVLELESCVVLE